MRAVIYVPQGQAVGEQTDELLAYCLSRKYTVVGVVHTLTAAEQMFALGEADVFVLASRQVLPMRCETLTDEIRKPPPRRESPNPPERQGRLLRTRDRPRRLQ